MAPICDWFTVHHRQPTVLMNNTNQVQERANALQQMLITLGAIVPAEAIEVVYLLVFGWLSGGWFRPSSLLFLVWVGYCIELFIGLLIGYFCVPSFKIPSLIPSPFLFVLRPTTTTTIIITGEVERQRRKCE